MDSSKNLVNEYSSKAGSLAAQLTTVVEEAAKIFKSLPLEINKFGTEREKPVETPTLAYSPIDKSWGITVVNDKKVQLAADCYGGIVFTPSGSGEGEKKVAFKVVESPEGGAITFGVANPEVLKEKNFEINYDGEPGLYGMCSFGFLPQELQGAAFIYAIGDTIDITWNPKLKKLSFARRHGIQKCETTLPVED